MNNINLHRLNLLQNSVNRRPLDYKNDDSRNEDFSKVLEKAQTSEIRFSKHASIRMKQREVTLDKCDIKRLTEAIGKAQRKGVRDALIIMDNEAFIANVKNNIIVTAVDKDNLNGSVFTNIDGTVII